LAISCFKLVLINLSTNSSNCFSGRNKPGTYTQTAKAGGNYSCSTISRTITVTADPQPAAAEQPAA
jgi:hypothetical protein